MGLIRDLLHCFILPHSKAYVELSRLEKNSIVAPTSLEASPASGVQRSASTNAVYPTLVVGSPDLRSIPRYVLDALVNIRLRNCLTSIYALAGQPRLLF